MPAHGEAAVPSSKFGRALRVFYEVAVDEQTQPRRSALRLAASFVPCSQPCARGLMDGEGAGAAGARDV